MSDTKALSLVKKDVVNVVEKKVEQFIQQGELNLPENYSPSNAMKAAWLVLQSTVNAQKKPVLQACTRDSIANALLDMVVQGLTPAKKQGYFIAYGNTLTFQRSYFGTMAIAKQLTDATDIHAQVVYKGDEFEYEIKGGNKAVTKHTQSLDNVDYGKIVGAYCVITRKDHEDYTDIMTMDQIKKSWSKSKVNTEKDTSTHQEYKEEMSRKTVINRACKALINSSSDEGLVLKTVKRNEELVDEVDAEAMIADEANKGEVIDIKPPEMPGTDTAQEEPDTASKIVLEPKKDISKPAPPAEEKPKEASPEPPDEDEEPTLAPDGGTDQWPPKPEY